MIHKIKSLYNDGKGLSKRKIARELGISPNTVSKYLELSAEEIAARQSDTERIKRLDRYREYVIHLLQTYPKLSAAKVLRKLKEKEPDLVVSDRSVRRYVRQLKQEIHLKQKRYYEPVLDMIPGAQCQVDGGELRDVLINGVETTVYLMVFVLSYSRLMHVSVSQRPITTEILIQQHDAAFRYFGGRPEECVYDQTRLVVTSEVFRELEVNQKFHQYATAAGFHIRACEGYDPESKGKVEAGVKYVKNNGLYGETFANWSDLESRLADWLDQTANQRIHGSTQMKPQAHYDAEEKKHMQPYLTPSCIQDRRNAITARHADKTGLISWRSNKYSVPLLYQRSRVGVFEEDGMLRIYDLSSEQVIAEHAICLEKNRVIKNTDHYRDKTLHIEKLESEVQALLSQTTQGEALCAMLKATSPRIYKDQLVGVRKILTQHQKRYGVVAPELMDRLLQFHRLTATGLRDCLQAWHRSDAHADTPAITKKQDGNACLSFYAALHSDTMEQEGSHVDH